MSTPEQPGTDIAVTSTMPAELIQQFAEMAMMLPDETGDAVENIITAILNSPTWENLSDPWESTGAEKLAGRTLLIHAVQRRPSDYKDGLGLFLVVHCTDIADGENVVFTTSSTSVVAQLVRAYAMGWLPLYGEIVVATRRTKNGYLPHHLKFTGRKLPASSGKG